MHDKSDSGGARSSQWWVARRCMDILQRLMREPATGDELRQIIIHHADRNGEGQLNAKAVDRRFEEDRNRLRDWLGCEIIRDPKTATYTLKTLEHPLIDLSGRAVEALAFLKSNFASPNTPMGEEVMILIEQITLMLPAQTRHVIETRRRMIEMDLAVQDFQQVPEKILRDIDATLGNRVLEILYQSNTSAQAWWYDVEPERLYAEKSHLYLYARCQRAHDSAKKNRENIHITFRVDRILDTRPLPSSFIPKRHKTRPLTYVLMAEVARGGVTEHFKGQSVSYDDVGNAVVTTESANLFVDLRKLLHYGPACQVIGGDEAVEQMKNLVRQMSQIYE